MVLKFFGFDSSLLVGTRGAWHGTVALETERARLELQSSEPFEFLWVNPENNLRPCRAELKNLFLQRSKLLGLNFITRVSGCQIK